MEQQAAHVIGYRSWKDFIRRVRAARPEAVLIHTYHEERFGPGYAMVFVWAEAAFASRNEVHVAKFLVASPFRFEFDEAPDQYIGLEDQARLLLHNALVLHGVEAERIRGGFFAEASKVKVRADPEGLWHLEGMKLVPEFGG